MKKLKALIIAPNSPLPAINGSCLDAIGVIQTLQHLNYEVKVISFGENIENNNFFILNTRRLNLKYFYKLISRYPWQAKSRVLSKNQVEFTLEYCPDLIVCIQEYSLLTLFQLSELRNAKIILRRANDERKFLKAISREAKVLYKWYLFLEILKFQYLESKIEKFKLDEVWDIEPNLKKLNVPTFVTGPIVPVNKDMQVSNKFPHENFTVIHVGNLKLGHAVSGILWLIEEVWPIVVSQIPMARLIIAGFQPDSAIQENHGLNGVVVIPNPEDLDDIFEVADTFVNPVFSGSGVNMKIGDPATQGIPIISTNFGIRGYENIKKYLLVSDKPEEFAKHIIKLYYDPNFYNEISKNLITYITQFKPHFKAQDFIKYSTVVRLLDDE